MLIGHFYVKVSIAKPPGQKVMKIFFPYTLIYLSKLMIIMAA